MSDPVYMEKAKADIGKDERTDREYFNKRIKKDIGIDFDVKAEPWCALWVGMILEESGYSSTKKANARSYLEWGKDVPKGTEQAGDIVVFWRGTHNDGVTGHVGFIVSANSDSFQVLGGNQNDEVCIEEHSRAKVLGVRRYRSAWESHTIRTAVVTTAGGVVEVVKSTAPSVETISDTKTLLEQAMGYFPNAGHMLGIAIIAAGAYIIIRKLREMKHV